VHVVKNLLEANNRRFIVLGANMYLLPFYTRDDGTPDPDLARVSASGLANLDALFSRVAAEGFNSVRVPIGLATFGSTPASTQAAVSQIVKIARTAEAHGLYAIFSWFDATALGASFPRHYSESFPSMAAVAAQVRTMKNVIIEPYNEPNNVSWHDWEAAMSQTLRYWRTNLDYKGILIVDTIDWSWNFDPGSARRLQRLDINLLGGADPQIVFANHRYATTNACFCSAEAQDWTSKIEHYVKSFPIVGTEYGNFSDTGPPQPGWVSQFLTHLSDSSVPRGLDGFIAFVWNWVDANTMTTTTGALTPYGQQVVDAVHRVRASTLGNG